MACREFWECLLKLLNFLLTVVGLAMVGYGVYLLITWNNISSGGSVSDEPISPAGDIIEFLKLGRPMLGAASSSRGFLDTLPKAWFIYLFIGIGGALFIISCFGFIGAATRSGCCLSVYSFLLILLILTELGAAAFMFFDHSWKDIIPVDQTGNFDMIYDFLEKNWKIAKWVALGVVVFEALVFLLALVVRAVNAPVDYDSDDEYIAPRSDVGQPLINQQGPPATVVSVSSGLEYQLSGRNDSWSQRMREKYGLDTSKFTCQSSDANKFQQSSVVQEERASCYIM